MPDQVQYFITICVAFTSVCVAFGWLFKIIRRASKPIKKPIEDVKGELGEIDKRSKICADMFANDNKRLDRHESELKRQSKKIDQLSEDIKQLLENDLLTLTHIQTGNSTGDIGKRIKELQTYIVKSR